MNTCFRSAPAQALLKQFEVLQQKVRAELDEVAAVLRALFRRCKLGRVLRGGIKAHSTPHNAVAGVDPGDINQALFIPGLRDNAHFDYAAGAQSESEATVLHVMILVALAIQDGFHANVQKSLANTTTLFATAECKSFQRMSNKVKSATDYRFKVQRPRGGHNADVMRNMAECLTADDMMRSVARLSEAFGGIAKFKNLFTLQEAERAARFHLTSLMVTVVHSSGRTYREIGEDPRVQELWARHRAQPQTPPQALWQAQVDRAVAFLRCDALQDKQVEMLGEVQLLFQPHLLARRYMHTL